MRNDHSWRNAEGWGPERPLGVWVLTASALLFAGVIPIITAVALLVTGVGGPELGLTPLSVLWTLALGTGVIAAAVAAWRGRRKGWLALIVLITVYYGLIGLNNALLLISGEAPPEMQSRMLARVVRSALYPVLYFWYYRRPGTQEFIDDGEPAGGGLSSPS